MTEFTDSEQAVELLQKLGLQEYEAKCFVALSRMPHGTAKEVSDISGVPRTRVYDAIGVLEEKGLAEVQHSNPQVFRAVTVEEAVSLLRTEYEERTDALREKLTGLDPVEDTDKREITQEVWSLTGTTAITTRTQQLVEAADDELILVVGHAALFTDDLADCLQAAQGRGVRVVLGTIDESLREHIAERLSDVEVFISGLEWLAEPATPDDETVIGRLLLIDGETILVSTYHQGNGQGPHHEQAVFGRGFDNGFVTVARRLMTTGFLGLRAD